MVLSRLPAEKPVEESDALILSSRRDPTSGRSRLSISRAYSWAVVGDPGRDYLWILARAPHLDDDSIAVARAAARDNGFDVDRLMPTSQVGAARP